MAEDFKVTPWEVTGDIDYDVLMKRFGNFGFAMRLPAGRLLGNLDVSLERRVW